MVKYVLWAYIIFFLIIFSADVIFGDPSSFRNLEWNINLFWASIIGLSICESIEKIRK